ncbi:MAG: tetratricopeptide repeat protein [Candidatus Cloacimonetes bacterium]|nr:tetratricopeptide repeat protein [Candidatus Cloacimonadota bacterium]
MKKIYFLILALIFIFCTLAGMENLKVAIIAFEKSDRESDYVVNSMMKRDFSDVFTEYEGMELIKIKDSEKAFKKTGYSNPSYMGKEEIAQMGNELGADVVIWGNVSSLSSSDYKVLAKIFSMKSHDVVAITFNVKKDTEQRKQAIQENLLSKIEEFSSGEVDKLLSIAVQHFNSKNYASAEESFLDLLAIDPENLEANFYMGLINYINKNYETSESYYLKALEIDSGNKDVLDYLSQTYLKQGKYDEAIDALSQIAENEEDKEIWLKIGDIYIDLEYYEEAEESYQKALEYDPDYIDAHVALGNLFYGQEYYNDAIPYFEFAARALPEEDDLQKKLAYCYRKTGQLESAIAQYKEIIAEQPDNFRAYVNLANAYNATEKYQDALNTSFRLRDIAPDDPRVYILISNSYKSLNNLQRAEDNANTAINMDPALYQPYRILSEIYQSRGYSKYEEYLDLEERARNAYGKEADELVERRDQTKDVSHNHFIKSMEYLTEARNRTDNRNELRYLASNEETLKQLLDATKKDFF